MVRRSLEKHKPHIWAPQTQATYLGATLTDAVDNHREVIKRIGEAAAAANQLRIFWSQARTTIAWKIRVLDSIVISKLLYSLETIQLTKSQQNRLDAWQHKMLRRILNVPPTHLDRTWTNQRVVNTLTQAHNYTHVSLSAKWKSRKLTLLGHILRATSADPMREVLFHPHTNIPRQEHIRRVGKPRAHWLIETLQDAYKHIHPDRVFDANNQEQINMLESKRQGCPVPCKRMRSCNGEGRVEKHPVMSHCHIICHRRSQRIGTARDFNCLGDNCGSTFSFYGEKPLACGTGHGTVAVG